MIDGLILAPYYFALKIRHGLYNHGIKKVHSAEVPTICIGNVNVGGTGKTPHTELVLRTLWEDDSWRGKNVAVLSRGYRRELKGFQQVVTDGTAYNYGDEPLQIKKKYPAITVAVDKDRMRGCDFLCHPEKLQTSRKARKCLNKTLPASDIIVLDDAFQYRALKPSVSIVLVDYSRPVWEDHLMPLGRLRDLPQRLSKADILIVSKCPSFLEDEEKVEYASRLGVKDYDLEGCFGTNKDGVRQYLFFTKVVYCPMEPVFPEGETRFTYSHRLIMFTGIANDTPLKRYFSDTYSIVRHLKFPDHHRYTPSDIRHIKDAINAFPTAVVATTEKDSQRVKDCTKLPDSLKQRLFRIPIEVGFLSREEKSKFSEVLLSYLKQDTATVISES